MKKVMLLGAGLVGKAMAIDLCRSYRVTVVDRNPDALRSLSQNHPIETVEADLAQPGIIRSLVKDQELLLGAVPGFMGFQTLQAVIAAGKDIVDISFFPEDPFALDALAKQKGVTAVVDCGVATGMSNLIIGHHLQSMVVDRFECLVGGLPQHAPGLSNTRPPSPLLDVIEEYLRPARPIEHGVLVSKPALSEAERVNLAPVGTLEAFNTDGLRTLLKTVTVPNMKEKTLRYPGHCQLIQNLRDSGFFSAEPIMVNGALVAPREMTSRLLLPQWQLEEDEKEFPLQ